MAKSSFEATQEFFDGWLELYQATIGKMAQVPAMGPAREKSEKLTEGFSRFANFFTASWDSTVDLQCVYMDAVSKFLATAAGEAEDENGFDGQEDFYKTWSETYGETFKEFLESGHFAEDTGKLMSSLLDVREYQRGMSEEYWLKPMDLPTKTDVDEVNAELYSLRKTVKALKKQVKDLSDLQNQLVQQCLVKVKELSKQVSELSEKK